MDYEQLKELVNKAIADYAQLGNSQKLADTKSAFAQKANQVGQTIDSTFNPTNADGTPNYGMGFAGTLNNNLWKKYVAASEQLTKNPKNAKRFNNTATNGRGQRLDMSEYYDITTRDGILSLLDGNAGKSKGKGQYTDKMVGLALREGIDRPDMIAIPNLQEIDTLRQLANNVSPRDTKLGHSAWSIANKFGGVLDDIKVSPNDKTKVQAPGNIGKIVDKFEIDPNIQMDVLQANQVYRPYGYNSMGGRFIYQGSDLEAPIAYPSPGEDYSHLKQFLYEHLKPGDMKNEHKFNPSSLLEFMNANGLSKEDLIKMRQTRSIKRR